MEHVSRSFADSMPADDTLENNESRLEANAPPREGPVARAIEKRTGRVPSDIYLWSAVACMGTSLTLKVMGNKDTSQFVGQWVAPLLLFGLYNKIVKVAGHDRQSAAPPVF